MLNKRKTNLVSFFKRNFIFIILLLFLILIEINITNYEFFVAAFHNLTKYQFEVNQGTIFGFTEVDGHLISEHNDPHITLRDINDRVLYISIQCANPNPKALSQVFYRSIDEDWDEENSITFSLKGSETIVSLPKIMKVASLRLDLTNKEGDTLTCQGFTLNPKPKYEVNIFRTSLFLFLLAGILVSKKVITEQQSKALWKILTADGIWFFILLIFFINMIYPLTITFDSAHYVWLADLIKMGDWAQWDPIRYPGLPLHIFLAQKVFGYHQNALLYPMIFFQSLLFIFACQIVFDVLELKKGSERILSALLIFLLIITDPTVLGYFHTLLTEFYAATLAVISCSIAIKLYKATLFSKRFYLLSVLYLFLVPLAWHVKQPYIGSALFPLLLVTLMIIIRKFSLKTLLFSLATYLAVGLLLVGSTFAWNSFLRSQGNQMKENRLIATKLDEKLSEETQSTKTSFGIYLEDKFTDYLAMSNVYTYDFRDRSVKKYVQIAHGNENTMIAHRLFRKTGESNIYYNSAFYQPYTAYLRTTNKPPLWLNAFFFARMKYSHFLFTITNLLLPVFVVMAVILWLKNKNILNASLLLLSASSLMNMVAHIILVIPNDRYQFWGYINNLLISCLLIICSGKRIQNG